jgi:peptide/nickel transport system substrate-binding protein
MKGVKLMGQKRIVIFFVILLGIAIFVPGYAQSAPAKKLIAAIDQEPTSLDPNLVYTSADYVVVENWADFLIHKVPDGHLTPGLATSWKMSPDGKEIEFTLRKGVKFQSGDPMTTRDVAFSFERARAKNFSVRTRLKSMKRLEIIDDYHFKVYFEAPDVTFIPNRGAVAIISKSYFDRVGEAEFMKHPIGTTGPYKVVKYVPGEYLDIERFEDYWGKKPSVKEARFYFVPEGETRVSKLKAGEADIINACPYPSVKDVESLPDLKTIRFPADHPTQSIVISNRNPKTPWHDRRVRLAMAYAIDCDTIINKILSGIPDHWAFLAPGDLGYDPDVKNYPYDPKKAKELLAEAGYPKGFDLTLYWQVTGSAPMSREVVEAIASYLEAVGIRTKLVGDEFSASMARMRASKGPDAEYVAYRGHGRANAPDPSYYLSLFFSKDGTYSLYSNPELEPLIAEARATVNDAKRAEVIKKAVKIIEEDVASIPIFNNVPVFAMKKNIDFTPTQKDASALLLVKDITIK